jgi:hypothetical protein
MAADTYFGKVCKLHPELDGKRHKRQRGCVACHNATGPAAVADIRAMRKREGARVVLPIKDGCAIVISDQHYYPGDPASQAHKAALKVARLLRPFAVVNNGDSIDGASISRWPVSSFVELGERPKVSAEIGEAGKRLREFEDLVFIDYRVWNLGNHDARFETRLAEKVPEYAGINGFKLKEHFPGWLPAWRTDFQTTADSVPEVIIKHMWKGGMYAAHNNALWAGVSCVSGHDHMLWDKPITDVRGTRWGMGAGTLAPIHSKHFTNYTQDNPVNWQSGFLILHFQGGVFVGPERVHALPDGRVIFRGKDLKV